MFGRVRQKSIIKVRNIFRRAMTAIIRPGIAALPILLLLLSHAPFRLWSRANNLDGRSAASAGLCSPYLGGIFDRALGGRYARRRNDAPQRKLDWA